MKKIVLLVFISTGMLTASAQVTVNLAAAADNTIYENPNTNSNAKGANMFSGTNGGGSPRRALIKFDLSVLPAGASITQVALTLNCNLSRSEPDVIALHKLTSNWGEGASNAGTGSSGDGAGIAATPNDATWLQNYFMISNWSVAGGDYIATSSAELPITATGFYTWNTPAMINDVQSWLASPALNYGWILINEETAIGTARKFGTRENTVVANRPVLSVTYIMALPVSLVEFKATTLANAVKLQWETAREINNAAFAILHSADGLHFEEIGSIAGAVNSTTQRFYEFIHQVNSAGRHYYKLAIIGTGGEIASSKVIQVVIKTTPLLLWVEALASSNVLKVYSAAEISHARFQILNIQGVLLQRGYIGNGRINMQGLTPGVYIIRVFVPGSGLKQVKFIKY